MILVTGSTGFVGRRVVEALTTAGYPVRALVHTPSRASVLSPYDAEIVTGDVLDPESLSRACDGVGTVVHLVAVLRESGSHTYRRVNYEGTRNLLESAASAGVKRIIYASAIGASSDPALPYLHSRWMAEQEVARSPIPQTTIRFSLGFGEGDEFINVMAAQVKLSPVVPVAGDGRTRFQPIAAEDVARCLVAAYRNDDTTGRTIEAGGPAYFTYEEMLDLIVETLGVTAVKVHVPVPVLRPVVAVLEALAPRPPVTRQQLSMLNLDYTADLDGVQTVFGFMPRPMVGNIGYISRIGLRDALKINLGFMPAHIRDQ